MTLRLNGSTSGYVDVNAPAIAGTTTITMPASSGTLVVTGGTAPVQFPAGNVTNPSITSNVSSTAGIWFPSANTIAISTSSNEQFRIDSIGNVGFGVTPASWTAYSGTRAIQVGEGASILGGGAGWSSTPYVYISNNTYYSNSQWRYTRSGKSALYTQNAAQHVFENASTSGVAGDPITWTTRAIIPEGGGFFVNTSTGGIQNAICTTLEASAADASRITVNHNGSASNDSNFMQFGYAGSLIGRIVQASTTSVSYTTTSDYRLKENISPISGAISRLSQLKPCRFNFISEPDQVFDGFIAHEAQSVVPEAVSGKKDAVDESGNIMPQGIDQSKLVPLLTAALQEALTKIDALEARIAALENA